MNSNDSRNVEIPKYTLRTEAESEVRDVDYDIRFLKKREERYPKTAVALPK